MHILNVAISLDPATGGGIAERTFQMSRYLVQYGVDCTVLTTDIGLTCERIKDLKGAQVLAVKCLWKRYYIPRVQLKHFVKLVRDADIVHFMGHWSSLNALVYMIARYLKKPYVVCPAGTLAIYGRSRLLKRIYNLVIGSQLIRHARVLIAIAENELPHLKSFGVLEADVKIIPNGINREDYTVRDSIWFSERYGLKGNPFILFMGRLDHIKGPDLLLNAFCRIKEKIPRYHMVFVGPDWGMLNGLKKIAENSEITDRVHFIGYLGGVEKIYAYNAAQCVVIPSRQDIMPMVALEAGITGKPVLMTDQCGYNAFREVDPRVIVPASIEGIEEGLLRILLDHDALSTIGIKLKCYIEENFSWNSIINRYIELYNQILNTSQK